MKSTANQNRRSLNNKTATSRISSSSRPSSETIGPSAVAAARSACRCPSKTNSSTNTSSMLHDLPIREYDKLSPSPIGNHCSSARSSISSAGSNAANENGTNSSASRKSCANPKIKRNNTTAATTTITIANSIDDEIDGTLNRMSKKGQFQQTNGTNNRAMRHCKSTNSDDTLILRISDLDLNNGRRGSAINGQHDANGARTKYRTKTEPNPTVASPKTKQPRRSSTSLVHQLSPRNGNHNANSSKCNCSSCNGRVGTHGGKMSAQLLKTKSVGTQHDAVTDFDPWIKQSDAPAIASANPKQLANHTKVIVITDDFKNKALNQEVMVDSKRRLLKYMKTNKSLDSSRSMDDVCIDNGNIAAGSEVVSGEVAKSKRKIVKTKTGSSIDNENDAQLANDAANTKAISKSVDNISLLSNELDNVGSVELIFISDEFLNKANNKQDVIVLKNNEAIKSCALKSVNGNVINDKQIVVVSDDFRRKSLQTDQKIVIIDKPKKTGNSKAHPKLSRQSSGESSVDDVNNKITSRAFQSYDEETENLESKEIKTAVLEETEILL